MAGSNDSKEILKRKNVINKLMKIKTGFKDLDSEKELKVDNFGSFLVTTPQMLSNEDLQKFFEKNPTDHGPKKLYETMECEDTGLVFDKTFIEEENDKFNNDFMFVGLNAAARYEKEDNGKQKEIYTLAGWQNFHDSEYNNNNITNTAKMYIQTNNKKFRGAYITDAIKRVIDSKASNVEKDFFLSSNIELAFSQDDYNVYKNKAKSWEKETVKELDAKRTDIYLKFTVEDKEKEEQENKGIQNKDDWKKFTQPQYKSRDEASQAVQANKEIFVKSADIILKEMKAVSPKHLLIFGLAAYHALQRMKELDEFKKPAKYANLIDDATVLKHYAGYADTFEEWFKNQPSPYLAYNEKKQDKIDQEEVIE